MTPATFFVKSLGCKTNQIEGQIIAQNLIEHGFKQASASSAQYYIINSCSVTSHTDSQTMSLVRQAKRQNKNAKVVLTGCMAQLLDEKPEGVDIVLGNDEKLEIAKFLESPKVSNIFSHKEFHHTPLNTATTTRPFIKIQEGCDNRCSYCIIPYARGASRSNSAKNITQEINSLAKKGFKEVVLTGTHIGQWGCEWQETLLDLLKEIEKTEITRYRLGSLYINEITDEMIEFLKSSKKFCPHFHLSLQSLCDKTLSNMNRNYSVSEALLLIQKLKISFDKPFLGCDIIVGFPKESDEDFQTTFLNLEKSALSKIHCFPYSKRKGTPAFEMKEQIDTNTKKERVKKVLELSEKLYKNFLNENTGATQEVLFEKKSKQLGLNTGFTRNYIKIFLDNGQDLKNTLKNITLQKDHFYPASESM